MRKLFCIIAALVMLLATACAFNDIPADPENNVDTIESSEPTESDTQATPAPEPDEAPVQTVPLPVHTETEIGEVVYDPMSVSRLYEAEEGRLTGYAVIQTFREGFSGAGYVSGVSFPDSALVIEIEVEAPQHYNISVCGASDSPVEGVLYVDGLARGKIAFSGSGQFESVKFENIYLTPDEATVSIGELTGACDIDFVLLESSTAVYDHDYSVSGVLSYKNASEKTVKLYKYLCEMYGEGVFSGQQCAQGSNAEIDAIARITGKYPAIRFGELMGYSEGVDTGDIELAIEYAQKGGMVGYVWNWMQNGSCYLEKSGFDVEKAVTDHDIAKVSREKLQVLYENNGISEECLAIIDGIDAIAGQLKRLKDENIPVIFRPLPEAGNGRFWWSKDRDSYLWLYDLIHTRLTAYHMLDNIIWVWNAQDPDWYVGDELCDIISLDIYDFSHGAWDNQSHINAMLKISELSSDKPVAMSECNVLPGPANIVKDNSYWLFASVWSEDYALDPAGQLSYEYMSDAEWIMFYNCSEVVVLDELAAIG